MNKYWILDGEHHAVETSLHTWAEWFENPTNRIVGYTQINSEVWVSTVFLGLDHNWSGRGPPVLFETMVFNGDDGREMWRYSSWDDAETGHAAVVKRLRASQKVLK